MQNVLKLDTVAVMTIGVAVQAMLVGMPAPRDLQRIEVDGQVLICVVAEQHARPDGDEHLAVDLDAVQVAW